MQNFAYGRCRGAARPGFAGAIEQHAESPAEGGRAGSGYGHTVLWDEASLVKTLFREARARLRGGARREKGDEAFCSFGADLQR